MTRTRQTRRRTLLHHLHTPLARWGFTLLATLAVLTNQVWPCAFATCLAVYGWRTHPKPRHRTRR